MRFALLLIAVFFVAPAYAVEIGEDFGSTEDYAIVHAGGPAIASISAFEAYDFPPHSFLVEVSWDGQTEDWTDSFNVMCPGSGDVGVDETGGDDMFYNPKISGQKMTGKLQLMGEVWARTCQIDIKN